MKIKQFTFYMILIISSIYLTACSDTPPASQLRAAVQQRTFIEEYQSIFMIRNIKKVNGYMLEDFYHAEMEYDRLCLVDINHAISMLSKEINSKKSNDLFDELSKSLHALASQSGILKASLVNQYGEFQKGDTIKEKITLKFLKTEKGWRFYK